MNPCLSQFYRPQGILVVDSMTGIFLGVGINLGCFYVLIRVKKREFLHSLASS